MTAWKRRLLGVGAGGRWAGAQSPCGLGEEGGSDPVKKAVCWLANTIQGSSCLGTNGGVLTERINNFATGVLHSGYGRSLLNWSFLLMLWHLCVCRSHGTTSGLSLCWIEHRWSNLALNAVTHWAPGTEALGSPSFWCHQQVLRIWNFGGFFFYFCFLFWGRRWVLGFRCSVSPLSTVLHALVRLSDLNILISMIR